MIRDLIHESRSVIEYFARLATDPKHVKDDIWRVTTLTEFPLLVSDQDESIGVWLLKDGYWEMWITKFFMEYIQPGEFVLDIGANYGYYTALFSSLVGDRGEVHAFEPNADVFKLFYASMKQNGFENVVCYDVALSDGSQTHATLRVPGNLIGCGSIELTENDAFAGYEISSQEVRVDAIDDLYNPGEIDFIKIDAEASEEKIIYGAKNVIENTPGISICLEWHPARFKNPEAFVDYLFDIEFSIYKISTDSRTYMMKKEELISTNSLEMLLLKR